MSWQDKYQKGSFRGVQFRTEEHEGSGGRRVAMHEFPGRDEPVNEDLGRRARAFSITCHVIGSDYTEDRDALIDALEESGPGLLVHPWRGQMMVVVNEFNWSESTEEGGMCRFSISFGEAGVKVTAPQAQTAGQAAQREAAAREAVAPERFAKRFSIDGAATFVEDSANRLIDGMAEVSRLSAALQGGIGPTLRAFDAGLRFLPANVSSLLRAPIRLGQAIVGLVQAVSLLGGTSRTRIAGLTAMLDWEPGLPEFPVRTAQRRQEAANQDALLWIFRLASGAELARVAAEASWASYEEAVAARDAITGRFDRLALAAADAGDDDAAQDFDALRRALVRDLAARVPTLARVYAVQLARTEPALAIANRFYGFAGIEARADALAARNRVIHPLFVPAGSDLEVLSLSGAPAGSGAA